MSNGANPTIDEIVAICGINQRVCPLLQRWNELWEMLPNRKRVGLGYGPSLPLILAAWHHTSDPDKAERLKSHLVWAAQHEALPKVKAFLRSLPEDQWHHEGE